MSGESNFQLEADSDEAHLLESLMPGDEFTMDMDGRRITLQCKVAEADAMTPEGGMTWTKEFVVVAVDGVRQ